MKSAETALFCTECGTRLVPGAAFCPECGKPVRAPFAPNVPPGSVPPPPSGFYPPGQPARQAEYRPQQMQAAFSGKGVRAPSPKAPRAVWFAVLAAAVLVCFTICGLSWVAVVSGLAAVAAAFLLYRTAAKKAGLALLISSAAVCAVLFAAYWPSSTSGAFRATISPGGEAAVRYGDSTIVIPAGTVEKNETLVVKRADALPPAFKELEPLCPPFDVSLGDLKRFETPILIEIPYDAAKLKKLGVDPSSGFIAVYFDEASRRWVDVPYEVDAKNSVVRLIMYHLTTVQCYYSLWEGAFVYSDGTVTVVYEVSKALEPKYAAYEKYAGRSTGVKNRPQFVVDLAEKAKLVLDAYRGAGLSVPDSVKIYVTDSTNNYSGITGNISISLDVATLSDPPALMTRNVAHELFHAAQALGIGWFDFGASGLKNSSFWLEATADYMANTGVWSLIGASPIGKYDYYNLDFFEKSLFEMDGVHEYEAANFALFMQNLAPIPPSSLIAMCEEYSAFPDVFYSAYGSMYTLEDALLAFLEYSVSNPSSNFAPSTNSKLEAQISNKVKLEFKLDENGAGVGQALEGSASLSFPAKYTAGFCVFTTNCDTLLTLAPDSDVVIYRFDRSRADRGSEHRAVAYGGTPTEISFGKDSFILVMQVSPEPGSIGIKYMAEPARPDFSGQWTITSMSVADVYASDEYWSAVKKAYGYDKSSYISEMNAAFSQVVQKVFFLITAAPGGAYTLELNSQAVGGSNLSFSNVTVVGDKLSAEGTFLNGMSASLTATVAGDTMTGQLQAEAVFTSGETSIHATDVIQFEAVRANPPAQ